MGTLLKLFEEPLLVGEVSSTQEVVKGRDFPPFKPLVAQSQTGGRGRKGNRWFSPPKAGLYLSVKIPKDFFHQGDISALSLVCGLAVSQTVDSYILSQIKWPNDVYVRGKKISGILIEADPRNLYIGIGVNLNIRKFPPELANYVTSLYLELGYPVEFSEFTPLLLEILGSNLLEFRSYGFKPFKERIERKLLWKGKRVLIDNSECGRLLGIDERGLAVLKTCYGKIKKLPYGDISLRKG